MKKIFLSVIVISGILFCQLAIAKTWQDITEGLGDTEFYSIGGANNAIFVGATNGLYRKVKDGWRQIFICHGQYRGINDIYINGNVLYIATKNGLYKSSDFGNNWKRSFKGMAQENNCICVVVDPYNEETIYLGTERGLFWSIDGGKLWKKFKGEINDFKIKSIAIQNTDYLYVICGNELFKINKESKSNEKLFGMDIAENLEDASDNEDMPSNEETFILNSIIYNVNILYLSTNRGLFTSDDTGRTWQHFENEGLLSRSINYVLLPDDNEILVATQDGVFQYVDMENIWKSIYRGMDSTDVKRLMYDGAGGFVWAISKNKVYRMNYNNDTPFDSLNSNEIMANFANEPTIREVQEMAINYAEVYPGKIEKWRRQAKFKALLPKVSFGINRGRSDTYEIYTSSSTSYWLYGPEDKTEGWDLDFSWDLSDLVWNESQTSIDVRSKLMVQLRDDIVDEVTRLYFERRRLQIEMITDPPVTSKNRLEKTLRIEELTAGIDGLSGGGFSGTIEQSTDKTPK